MSVVAYCATCNTGFPQPVLRCPICRRENRRLRAEERRSNNKRRKRISKGKRARVFDRDGGKCLRCGSARNLTLDHVVALSRGGTNSDGNLQTLCGPCNRAKKGKTVDYRP